jgi:rRNA maturation endonuclease Nob1
MEKKTTYILDTTALIEDPDVIYRSGNADWVIPLAVIREIDGLKNSEKDLVAKAARQIARTLDRLGSYGDFAAGVKLSTGSLVRIVTEYEKVEGLASEADNRIVGTALKLKRKGENITLMTTDANMRTVARVHGLKTDPHQGAINELLKYKDQIAKTPVEDMREKKMALQEYKKTLTLKIILKVFAVYLTPFVILALWLKHGLGNEPTTIFSIFFAVTILPLMLYTILVPFRMLKFMRCCEMDREVHFKRGSIRKWVDAIKYGMGSIRYADESDDDFDEIDYYNARWASGMIKRH